MQQVTESASVPRSGLRVLIAGGGTGGHVIPALAIARELRDRYDAEVRLLGTSRGIETKLVPGAGFPLELMQVGQLANVSLTTRLKTLADLPRGIVHCIRLIRGFKPAVVVGVGGYASGPAMLAAIFLRVPTLVYEPNAVPGMVNRVLGKRVSDAAVAFSETCSFFRHAEVTGVPVRAEIAATGSLLIDPPRLLVTAGSNGAKVFNDTLPAIMPDLLRQFTTLSVVHQTGERAVSVTKAAYNAAGNYPGAGGGGAHFYAICRSSLTAQRWCCRAPAARWRNLPRQAGLRCWCRFPRRQTITRRRTLRPWCRLGAAVLLRQQDLTAATLLDALTGLLRSPQTLVAMSEAARARGKTARPGAHRGKDRGAGAVNFITERGRPGLRRAFPSGGGNSVMLS